MVIEITKQVFIAEDGKEFDTLYKAKDYENFEAFKWFVQSMDLGEFDMFYSSNWITDSIPIDKLWDLKDKIVKFLIENKYIDIDKIMEE